MLSNETPLSCKRRRPRVVRFSQEVDVRPIETLAEIPDAKRKERWFASAEFASIRRRDHRLSLVLDKVPNRVECEGDLLLGLMTHSEEQGRREGINRAVTLVLREQANQLEDDTSNAQFLAFLYHQASKTFAHGAHSQAQELAEEIEVQRGVRAFVSAAKTRSRRTGFNKQNGQRWCAKGRGGRTVLASIESAPKCPSPSVTPPQRLRKGF